MVNVDPYMAYIHTDPMGMVIEPRKSSEAFGVLAEDKDFFFCHRFTRSKMTCSTWNWRWRTTSMNWKASWLEILRNFGSQSIPGWWFGCHFLFSQKYWVSNHPNWLYNIFQRGSNHQPATCFMISNVFSLKFPAKSCAFVFRSLKYPHVSGEGKPTNHKPSIWRWSVAIKMVIFGMVCVQISR